MFRNSYQRGMLTIFFSVGSKPLAIWETHTQDGYITRFLDQDIKSMVLEIGGTNVSTTYITCPKGNMVLGITMPFLVMIVKNLKKYFSFEVTILDETLTRRRFRVSNFQSSTQILPLCTVMPIGLSDGWNQIQFNLAEFTRRAYKKQFVEVQKLKINANIRLRRIYFTEKLIPDDQLPPEYKLFFPLPSKGMKGKQALQGKVEDKGSVKPSTSQFKKPQEQRVRVSVEKIGSQVQVASVKTSLTQPPKEEDQEKNIVPEGDKPETPQVNEKVEDSNIPAEVIEDNAPIGVDETEGANETGGTNETEGTNEIEGTNATEETVEN